MNLNQFQKNGKYLMLAFDHRGSFKKLINPEDPDSVSDQMAIDLKKEIIDSVKDQMTGVLVDEDYGLPGYPDHNKPYLLPAEKTGYTDQAGERVTELQFTAQELKDKGASGAKLLLYFNPHYETFQKQIDTALKVQKQCQALDFPYFLEIRIYTLEDPEMKTPRAELLLLSLRELIAAGVKPDVWKLEYPGNKDGCEWVTDMVKDTPWILLTKGVAFEDFKPQLKEAIDSGAVGFLVGRALWQEVCSMQGEEKEKFLKEVIPNRFKEISEIVLSS